MLHRARALSRYEVVATDGKLGKAVDAYFEESTRQIRCLVVDTGHWLPGKRLLLPRKWLGLPDIQADIVPAKVTREEAEACQTREEDLPVSWQQEELLRERFGGLDFHSGAPEGGMQETVPQQAMNQVQVLGPCGEALTSGKVRSLKELIGYRIEALDGPLGVAEDFLIEDGDWAVRYIIVDTKSWKPGREVLVPPHWIEHVSWNERRIHLRISRQKVKTSQRAMTGSHFDEER